MSMEYDANLVMKKIQDAYLRECQKLKKLRDEQIELGKIADLLNGVAYESFIKKCRKPQPEEYAGWVSAYLMKEGSNIDEVLPFDLEEAPDFLIVNDEGAKITRLYGSKALRIIVPEEREIVLDTEIGDNIIYFCKDASVTCWTLNRPKVPIFRDVMALLGAVAAAAKVTAS